MESGLRSIASKALFPLVITAALIIALVLFETYLVINKHTVLSPLPDGIRLSERGSETVWQKANFSGTSPLTGIHYETNELGFRSESIGPEKDIFLALGDSTTYGLNLEAQNSYPNLLENELNSRMGPGQILKVVNTAFPGQGTIMQYFLLRCIANMIGEERIKGVSLGFFHNDFSNNVRDIAHFQQIGDLDCKDTKHPYTYWSQSQNENGLSEARRKSNGHNWPKISDLLTFQLLRAHYRAAFRPPFGEFRSDDYVYRWRKGREVEWDLIAPDALSRNRAFTITLETIAEMSDWLAARRIPFKLVFLPAGEKEIAGLQNSPSFKKLILKEICGRPFVSCIDMVEEYRRHLDAIGHQGLPLPKGYYSRRSDAGHPGPAASQLITRALVRSIQSSAYAETQ